jgi:hypothetical protein
MFKKKSFPPYIVLLQRPFLLLLLLILKISTNGIQLPNSYIKEFWQLNSFTPHLLVRRLHLQTIPMDGFQLPL